jgi:hypothetical protein
VSSSIADVRRPGCLGTVPERPPYSRSVQRADPAFRDTPTSSICAAPSWQNERRAGIMVRLFSLSDGERTRRRVDGDD